MNRTGILAAAICIGLSGCASSRPGADSVTLSRIAFGSCANQLIEQPIWDAIAAADPDIFVFAGDAIYADYDGKKVVSVTEQTLRRDWAELAAEPHFASFRAQTDILATWDNHDYGTHDGGAEFSLKNVSKATFLDFFGEDPDSERRRRPGLYDAKTFGGEGRRVQLILLDTRYFKSLPVRDPRSTADREAAGLSGSLGKYLPNTDVRASLLGPAQWKWLERQLAKPADIRFIVSSTQVIPDQKGMDEWGNYPHERRRLLDLIDMNKANGVILLTGNVHFAEISVLRDRAYPMYEFTSSGLTHTNQAYAEARNDYRVSGPFDGLNFGRVDIDWAASPSPRIHMQVVDMYGETVIEYSVALDELQHTR